MSEGLYEGVEVICNVSNLLVVWGMMERSINYQM